MLFIFMLTNRYIYRFLKLFLFFLNPIFVTKQKYYMHVCIFSNNNLIMFFFLLATFRLIRSLNSWLISQLFNNDLR